MNRATARLPQNRPSASPAAHRPGNREQDQRVDGLHGGDRERVRGQRHRGGPAQREVGAQQRQHRQRVAEDEGQRDGQRHRGHGSPAERGGAGPGRAPRRWRSRSGSAGWPRSPCAGWCGVDAAWASMASSSHTHRGYLASVLARLLDRAFPSRPAGAPDPSDHGPDGQDERPASGHHSSMHDEPRFTRLSMVRLGGGSAGVRRYGLARLDEIALASPPGAHGARRGAPRRRRATTGRHHVMGDRHVTARAARRDRGPGAPAPGRAALRAATRSTSRGLRAAPDAAVLPATTEQVAQVVSACCTRGVPVVPRGGGTGFAGGAVATSGGVVLALERMTRVRSFDPLLWRMEVEAGLTTRDVQRLARENGLLFPPDPGAAEQSQIGGNVATERRRPARLQVRDDRRLGDRRRGGRRARRAWSARRPAAQGRRGLRPAPRCSSAPRARSASITAVWLRLIPRPEAALPVVAFYPDAPGRRRGGAAGAGQRRRAGGARLPRRGDRRRGGRRDAGRRPGRLRAARRGRRRAGRGRAPARRGASRRSAARCVHRAEPEAAVALARGRLARRRPPQRGGKLSEDIAVPVERLAEAVDGVVAIGARARAARVQLGPRRRRQPARHVHDRRRRPARRSPAPRRPPPRSSPWPAGSAGASAASTASGSSSASTWPGLGPGRASRSSGRSSDAFDPEDLMNPGRSSAA